MLPITIKISLLIALIENLRVTFSKITHINLAIELVKNVMKLEMRNIINV